MYVEKAEQGAICAMDRKKVRSKECARHLRETRSLHSREGQFEIPDQISK